jgi:hypothetical protein
MTVGVSLIPVFFAGSLRAKGDDLEFWQRAIKSRMGPDKSGTRVDEDRAIQLMPDGEDHGEM